MIDPLSVVCPGFSAHGLLCSGTSALSRSLPLLSPANRMVNAPQHEYQHLGFYLEGAALPASDTPGKLGLTEWLAVKGGARARIRSTCPWATAPRPHCAASKEEQ